MFENSEQPLKFLQILHKLAHQILILQNLGFSTLAEQPVDKQPKATFIFVCLEGWHEILVNELQQVLELLNQFSAG